MEIEASRYKNNMLDWLAAKRETYATWRKGNKAKWTVTLMIKIIMLGKILYSVNIRLCLKVCREMQKEVIQKKRIKYRSKF